MSSASPTLLGILYGVIVMLLGALGYVARLFVTGQVAPRQVVTDLREDIAALKAENQTWRASDAENNRTIRVLAAHVGEFVDITRTVGGVLQTLPAAAPAREPEGDTGVAVV